MIGGEVGYSVARMLGPAFGLRVKPRRPLGESIPSIDSQVSTIEAIFPENVKEGPVQ